jgi:hypothetical protein
LTKVAESTKKVNEKVLLPGIKFGSKFDPGARLMQQTGLFKEKNKNVTPHEWAWRASTVRGPASKTGQTVLPIAGGLVGSYFGGPGGGALGAGFGRALAGVHAGERSESTYDAAGWTAVATGATAGAASGAGALGAGAGGRAATALAANAAVQKARGASNQQIVSNLAPSVAGMVGGYAGGYGGHLMTGSQLGAQVGGTLGSSLSSQAARFAILQSAMKQVAQQGAYPPTMSPATAWQSSASPAGAFQNRFASSMNPQTRRSLYQHLR